MIEKTFFVALSMLAMSTFADVVDTYSLTMRIRVPRVYNNTESRGYRKYQWQTLRGKMLVAYSEDGSSSPSVRIVGLTNATHSISGNPIGYITDIGDTRMNVIGDNARDVFKTPSVCVSFEANPDYAKADGEDNSILAVMSGTGSTGWVKTDGVRRRAFTSLGGYVTGTLGCGCSGYGHKSPTRVMGARGASDKVDDVASIWGRWNARRTGSTVTPSRVP